MAHGLIFDYPPPAQQTAPVPPPLWVEVRARFRFYRVPGVPWQGQQNFTIVMQPFSVTRYLNIEIAYSLP